MELLLFQGGSRAGWAVFFGFGCPSRKCFRMLRINLSGRGRVAEIRKNRKFSMEMEGAFPIREKFLFNGNTDPTTLTFKIKYDIHGKVTGSDCKQAGS